MKHRSRVPKSLRASELRYRRLFETAQDGILILDAQTGMVVDVNPFLIGLLGFSHEQFLGKAIWELGFFKDIIANEAKFSELKEQEYIRYENLPLETIDGKRIEVEFVSNVYLVDGIKVIQCNVRDITERRKAEYAANLRESALAKISQGVLICDEKRLITFANASFTKITGYDQSEVLGRSCSFLQGPDSNPDTIRKIRSSLNAEVGFEGEILNYRKDGETFWNELTIAPIPGLQGGSINYIGIQRDITERKRAAEELGANEVLLGQFIQHTPAAIAMLDTQMRYIQTSERWIDDYHLANQDIIGKSHYEVFPDAPERWKAIHQRALAGAVEKCEEDPFPRADGSTDWLQWEIRPWLKAGGEIGGVIFFTQVITKRKLAEAEHNRLVAILESTTDMVAICDPSGHVLYFNRAGRRLLGLGQNEALDRVSITDFHLDSDGAAMLEKRIQVAVRTGSWSGETVLTSQNGIKIPVSQVILAHNDTSGKLEFLSTVVRDITDRKRADQSLKVALERLQLAMKAGKAGTWDHNLLTGEVDWDAQMMALYGEKEGTVEPGTKRWERAIVPEDLIKAQAVYEKAVRNGLDSFDTDFRIHRRDDGTVRHLRGSGIVLRDEGGNPLRMTGINWDITEERGREEKLNAALAHEKELSEEARAGARAKSEFLAVMSHEIRTPMNSILGFSDLLVRSPDLPFDCREYVNTITSSGEALLRIIDDILDFSRLEAGGLQVEKSLLSPNDIVNDIYTLLSPRAEEKHLKFQVMIDAGVPDHLWNDAGRLRQVLLNLVGNAIKFTARGSIILGVRVIDRTIEKSPLGIEFFVRDTGPGIRAEDLDHIFEPFAQADSSISRRYGGTGLGLSISKKLGILMGGEVCVSSEFGNGSEFCLALPSFVPSRHNVATTSLPEATLDKTFAIIHPLKILLVEDDRVNLKLMITMLHRLGYQPTVAQDGIEAVERYKIDLPDCILMDLQMPLKDGLQATLDIRAIEGSISPFARTFISALTANILSEDRRRCSEVGMDGYLNKPIRFSILATALEQASRRKSNIRPIKN